MMKSISWKQFIMILISGSLAGVICGAPSVHAQSTLNLSDTAGGNNFQSFPNFAPSTSNGSSSSGITPEMAATADSLQQQLNQANQAYNNALSELAQQRTLMTNGIRRFSRQIGGNCDFCTFGEPDDSAVRAAREQLDTAIAAARAFLIELESVPDPSPTLDRMW